MGVDVSRSRFDPLKDFESVLLQQGRLLLDADFNEYTAMVERRRRAETLDLTSYGPDPDQVHSAWVPRLTPDAFRITASGGALTIGRGRMYVDGLLAENHGEAPYGFDPMLAERTGTTDTSYDGQPYVLTPDALPSGGPHLAYLDVWQREVTHLEEPGLVEVAVGVDTTARLQTVWQVRLLENIGDVSCDSADEDIPGWLDLIRSSAGRLTTGTVPVDPEFDPCELPPTEGFRGSENQTYRVEVHEGGAPGSATFKWSRDNASVAMLVDEMVSPTVLRLTSLGKDDVLRVSTGHWVEILDDRYELAQRPGVIRKVTVDEAARTITFAGPLPTDLRPADAEEAAARHLRVRRWDQSDPTGLITIPASASATIPLEHGIVVSFSIEGTGGQFRSGDYWIFAARTANTSIEILDAAPPLGTHHHYARLGIVDFPDSVTDCRVHWPPVFEGGEKSCDCTVCVTADSHSSGTFTIQEAVDQVKEGGGTVCLGPGLYRLDRPVRISEARSLRLHGQGWRTVLLQTGSGPGIVIDDSLGVTVEDLAVIAPEFGEVGMVAVSTGGATGVGMALMNNAGVTIQRCGIAQLGRGGREATGEAEEAEFPSVAGLSVGRGPAIAMSGFQIQTRIRENVLAAGVGILGLSGFLTEGEAGRFAATAPRRSLTTANLFIDDNVMLCALRGVSLEGLMTHLAETRISRNLVAGCSDGGIVTLGSVVRGGFGASHLAIERNTLMNARDAIVVGTDDTRIEENDVGGVSRKETGDGIVLASGLRGSGLKRCRVTGNRVTAVGGAGVAIRGGVVSALIKDNTIEGSRTGGIVMDADSEAEDLVVESNHLLNIAAEEEEAEGALAGIRLRNTVRATVVGNSVIGVGRSSRRAVSNAGIEIQASRSIRIATNEVQEVGPLDGFEGEAAGIEVTAPFERLDVVDNVVQRGQDASEPDDSRWWAVLVRPLERQLTFHTFLVASERTVFAFEERRVARIPRGREIVALRGNLAAAYGVTPAIEVVAEGACVVSDNRCSLLSREGPVVALRGGAAIAGGNYLEGPEEQMAMDIQVGSGPFTVVGNIGSGPIEVNGSALGAPWSDLNAVAP
jgi:Family of unknown function (DUF6519)/Right handed beta helix region